MNVKAPARVDSWAIVTSGTGAGINVLKNGRKLMYYTSFEKAWSYVTNQGTPGDKIEIRVNGELSVS